MLVGKGLLLLTPPLLKGEVSQKNALHLYTAVVVVDGGLAFGLFPGSATSWLTVPAHKTRVISEVVTTFSSFQVP